MLLSCALNYLPEPGRRGVAPAPEQAAPCLLLKTGLKKLVKLQQKKKLLTFCHNGFLGNIVDWVPINVTQWSPCWVCGMYVTVVTCVYERELGHVSTCLPPRLSPNSTLLSTVARRLFRHFVKKNPFLGKN